MKILVFGGTGAMGIHLVRILSNNQHDVYVTTRKQRKSCGNIKYLIGDAHDLYFVRKYLEKKWDVIIDFMVYNPHEFEERIDLLLISTQQYIFLSSSRVYASSEKPLLEISPRLLDIIKDEEYLKTNEYALAKAREEDSLKKSKYKNWTIIRPYITYSYSRLQLGVLEKEDWLYRALKERTIVFSKDIAEKFTTLTFGSDVSGAIVKTINNPKAFGEIFHITTNTFIKWIDVLSIYLNVIEDRTGKRPKVLLLEHSPDVRLGKAKRYQVLYDRLYDRVFDNSKINQLSEVNNFIDPHSGLKKCLNKFLDSPQFFKISGKREGEKDRITHEKSSLKEFMGFKQKIAYLLYRYIF